MRLASIWLVLAICCVACLAIPTGHQRGNGQKLHSLAKRADVDNKCSEDDFNVVDDALYESELAVRPLHRHQRPALL